MRLKSHLAALLTLMAFAPVSQAGPALLVDAADGKILYAEDMDDQWHPASVTKVMTAYLTFEALKNGTLKADDKVTCSQRANEQQPSKIGLPVGGQMTVEIALQALIVKSANDVAVMLAEAVAGSEDEFVARMNATARRLGMSRTIFVNPNGLPAPVQVTTARDLARLARAVIHDYPQYAGLWSQSDMRFGKIRLGSHNGLLRTFEGADGLKTGFICDSGFNIIASATRDNRKLLAIVLGEPSGADRTVRAASLLEHGFQSYGWKGLFNNETIDNVPVPPYARNVASVRKSVVSWECGTGRRRPAVAGRKGKPKGGQAKVESGQAESGKKPKTAQGSKKKKGNSAAGPPAPVAADTPKAPAATAAASSPAATTGSASAAAAGGTALAP